MDFNTAKEMVSALLADNEMGISTLGAYGDEVSIALYKELEKQALAEKCCRSKS